MNQNETAAVLAYMAAAWPNQSVGAATAKVWAQQLVLTDPNVALDAAKRLVKKSDWFPTVAVFMQEVAAVKRAAEPEFAGLPPGPTTTTERDNVKRLLALCREVVTDQANQPHWHGGPEPCPTCGGICPDLGVRQKRKKRNGGGRAFSTNADAWAVRFGEYFPPQRGVIEEEMDKERRKRLAGG